MYNGGLLIPPKCYYFAIALSKDGLAVNAMLFIIVFVFFLFVQEPVIIYDRGSVMIC